MTRYRSKISNRARTGDGSPDRTVDRVILSLFACVLFLTVLFLWQHSYERSCLALVFPGLTLIAIFYGFLQYRLERKRFALDYYLDPASSLHRRLQRKWLSVSISLVAALSLAAFLVVFAARSRPTDWLFFCAAATGAPFLFNALSTWPGRHFRRDAGGGKRRATIADMLVARAAGTLLLAALAIVYIYAGYYLIPVPDDIDLDSLERTLVAFSAHARSACPVVEDTLLLATQVEGLSWYFATTAATSPWLHEDVRLLVWVGFFLNAAMVFAGFIRGLEGSILLACTLLGKDRESPASVRDPRGSVGPAGGREPLSRGNE